jgi:hypothetical protein
MADLGLWVGSDGVFGDATLGGSQGHPRVGGGGIYAAIRWIFGRRFLRICQRSYSACIVSHERAVILRNAANRIANSGLIDALPLTTREIAVRVIPSLRFTFGGGVYVSA